MVSSIICSIGTSTARCCTRSCGASCRSGLSLSTSERLTPPQHAQHPAPPPLSPQLFATSPFEPSLVNLISAILPLSDHDTSFCQHKILHCTSRVLGSPPWLCFFSFGWLFVQLWGLLPGCLTLVFPLLPFGRSALEAHPSWRPLSSGTALNS